MDRETGGQGNRGSRHLALSLAGEGTPPRWELGEIARTSITQTTKRFWNQSSMDTQLCVCPSLGSELTPHPQLWALWSEPYWRALQLSLVRAWPTPTQTPPLARTDTCKYLCCSEGLD